MESSMPPVPMEMQISLISQKCEEAMIELFDIWYDPQKEAVNVYFAAFRNAFTISAKQFNEASRDDLKEWLVAYLQWGFECDMKEDEEESIGALDREEDEGESDLDEA